MAISALHTGYSRGLTRRAMLAGAWLVGSGTLSAQQDGYPQHPITVIIPFPPGGIDSLVRLVGARAAALLGQPFVYKNQPGASHRIGMDALAHAPKDGYTIGVAAVSGMVTVPALAARAPYDPTTDFTPLVMVLEGPFLFVSYPGSGLRSLAQVVERARAAPGTLRIGSTGVGSSPHLVIEQLMIATGIRLVHVPYKGEAAMAAELAGGQIELAVTNMASKPLIDAGRITLLAVASERRASSLPDTPTATEAGIAMATSGWLGFAAPAGVPAAVRERLLAAFGRAARDPDVRAALMRGGTDPAELSGEAFAARIKREFTELRELNKTLGIAAE